MTQENSYNVWTCCGTQFTQPEIVEHLKTAHKVESMAGKRRMTMHLDGQEFFQSNYEWTVGDVVLRQVVRTERAADDIMRWA
jgi:hypothetical protein